jgi:hypothetical protein
MTSTGHCEQQARPLKVGRPCCDAHLYRYCRRGDESLPVFAGVYRGRNRGNRLRPNTDCTTPLAFPVRRRHGGTQWTDFADISAERCACALTTRNAYVVHDQPSAGALCWTSGHCTRRGGHDLGREDCI